MFDVIGDCAVELEGDVSFRTADDDVGDDAPVDEVDERRLKKDEWDGVGE